MFCDDGEKRDTIFQSSMAPEWKDKPGQLKKKKKNIKYRVVSSFEFSSFLKSIHVGVWMDMFDPDDSTIDR